MNTWEWAECVGGGADGRHVNIRLGDRWPYVAYFDSLEYVFHWYEADMDDAGEELIYRFTQTEVVKRNQEELYGRLP